MSDPFHKIQIYESLKKAVEDKHGPLKPLLFMGSFNTPYVELFRVQNKEGIGPSDTPGDSSQIGYESIEHLKDHLSEQELTIMETFGYKPQKVKAQKVWSSGSGRVVFEPYMQKSELKKIGTALPGEFEPLYTPEITEEQRIQNIRRIDVAAIRAEEERRAPTQRRTGNVIDINQIREQRGDTVPIDIADDTVPIQVPVAKAEGIELHHYSNQQGLKELDPQFQGTGVSSQEFKRTGSAETPSTMYYRAGTETEPMVTSGARSKYTVRIDPAHHKLLDMSVDRLNENGVFHDLKQKSYTRPYNQGIVNRDEYLNGIRAAGYHGWFNSGSHMPGVIALFDKHPIYSEEDLMLGKV